jgi:hypothetical protein
MSKPFIHHKEIRQKKANPNNRHFDALSQMSDEDLMSHFQAGTVEAFDILVAATRIRSRTISTGSWAT